MNGTAIQLVANDFRREILRLVWTQERCAGEIARCFKVTFGAISQHLTILRSAGVLRRRRDGKRLYYAANREALGPLAAALEAMWADKLSTLKTLAETEQSRLDAARATSVTIRNLETP